MIARLMVAVGCTLDEEKKKKREINSLRVFAPGAFILFSRIQLLTFYKPAWFTDALTS